MQGRIAGQPSVDGGIATMAHGIEECRSASTLVFMRQGESQQDGRRFEVARLSFQFATESC